MAATPTFRQSPPEYDSESENLFRRELETILLIALAVADSIASGDSKVASLTHKSHQYMPTIGTTNIP